MAWNPRNRSTHGTRGRPPQPAAVRRHGQQQVVPKIVVRELEVRRQYADDGAAHAVQLNHFADDLRRTAEAPLPQAIAQDRGRRRSEPVLLLRKIIPERRRRSHQIPLCTPRRWA